MKLIDTFYYWQFNAHHYNLPKYGMRSEIEVKRYLDIIGTGAQPIDLVDHIGSFLEKNAPKLFLDLSRHHMIPTNIIEAGSMGFYEINYLISELRNENSLFYQLVHYLKLLPLGTDVIDNEGLYCKRVYSEDKSSNSIIYFYDLQTKQLSVALYSSFQEMLESSIIEMKKYSVQDRLGLS